MGLTHLDEPLTVDRLADQARMSRRSFVRHFHQSTGTTPARWILEHRLQEARALLETTDWGIDTIAAKCGFGSSVTLRQRFTAAFATSPPPRTGGNSPTRAAPSPPRPR